MVAKIVCLLLVFNVVPFNVCTVNGFRPVAIENFQGIASHGPRSDEIFNRTAAKYCRDPNGIEGVCQNIKSCPIILRNFVRLVNQRDEPYIQYIRQSNAVCTQSNDPIICCPTKRRFSMLDRSSSDRETAGKPNRGRLPTPPPLPQQITGRLLTPEEGCGLGRPIPRPRTINPAFKTKPGVYPWVVLIGYTNGSLGECAGSLISSRHVLTSAHCVNDQLSTVRLGAFDINLMKDDEAQNVRVLRSVRHPDYNETNRLNDIALLQLEQDIEFTDRIRPICLPRSYPIRTQNFVDYNPLIAAWLRQAPVTQNTIDTPTENVMRDWQITIIENAKCRKQYKSRSESILDNKFDDRVMCADNINAGQSECKADAGLMQPIFNTKSGTFSFYQTGILAHGIGCKSTGVPVVYTRVQYFIDWIEKNM